MPIEDGFRANYHYCNLMFVVAGEVIANVSGMPWETFVQTRILDRVGMTETVPFTSMADPAKSALPHGRVGPPLRYQGPMTLLSPTRSPRSGTGIRRARRAGSAPPPTDWAKWIAVRLAMGALPDGTRLFSEATAREMWRPNIIVGSSPGPTAELPGRAIASTYAMGFQVQDYRGERLISHGGGSPGGISATVLIPGRNVGFAVFSNAEESFLLRTLRSGIADIVMGKAGFDWIADSKRLEAERQARSIAAAAEIDAKQAAGAPPSAAAGRLRRDLDRSLVRRHRDRDVGVEGPVAVASAGRRPCKGPLEPYDGDDLPDPVPGQARGGCLRSPSRSSMANR